MNLRALGEQIGLDEAEFRELIELFMETGRADYVQMKSAFDSGDAEQVARRAHTISGAAGNLGLMPVHEAAKRIELAAMEDRMASVSADVKTLNDHFDHIARQIGQEPPHHSTDRRTRLSGRNRAAYGDIDKRHAQMI